MLSPKQQKIWELSRNSTLVASYHGVGLVAAGRARLLALLTFPETQLVIWHCPTMLAKAFVRTLICLTSVTVKIYTLIIGAGAYILSWGPRFLETALSAVKNGCRGNRSSDTLSVPGIGSRDGVCMPVCLCLPVSQWLTPLPAVHVNCASQHPSDICRLLSAGSAFNTASMTLPTAGWPGGQAAG